MEHIYTIPVNEAFEEAAADAAVGCPLCLLRRREEERELDLILGASMMEPDIRIKTNREGFCPRHFRRMFERRNRLGLALMMESHLDEIARRVGETPLAKKSGRAALAPIAELEEIDRSCYLCGRIRTTLSKMTEVVVGLWESDPAFLPKMQAQTCFCLPHYRALLAYAKKKLGKKQFSDFYRLVSGIEDAYLAKLREDVGWFCKKFDYRYEEEPWYDAKDAVERTIRFVSGEGEKEGKGS